jgi:hypothetical protein
MLADRWSFPQLWLWRWTRIRSRHSWVFLASSRRTEHEEKFRHRPQTSSNLSRQSKGVQFSGKSYDTIRTRTCKIGPKAWRSLKGEQAGGAQDATIVDLIVWGGKGKKEALYARVGRGRTQSLGFSIVYLRNSDGETNLFDVTLDCDAVHMYLGR